MSHVSIASILTAQADRHPEAIAIEAPQRRPLTYRGLASQLEAVRRALADFGIGRDDRVALVLPQSAELAVAFLGVSACATVAPLNPSYRASEFEYFLRALRVRALVVEPRTAAEALGAASACEIPVVELHPERDAEAGIFSLRAAARPDRAGSEGFAESADIALVLHTSGTTARPKIVPLTHANICSSAYNIGATLRLTASDRGLVLMPLFHIHGLMGATLAPLVAGGSIVCPGPFEPIRFGDWLETFGPTWYTAVPTIHRAIVAAGNIVSGGRLRFVRSSSAALPEPLMHEVEALLGAPVVEAFGMTEASHQIASNPLPPGLRKPRSVGIAGVTEIAIRDGEGRVLGTGARGEIVIRGPNVTTGYENAPEANSMAFVDGWFRTGDEGYVDDEGYLFLTGRLKEMINRGGEKISPVEVENILIGHPAVAQAVTFAMPHTTLGEDVAAAVVLRTGGRVSEGDIRGFAGERLAPYKVPSQVVFVDEIPKGPTGKLQRVGLAERLGSRLRPAHVEPRTQAERSIAAVWARILNVDRVGGNDNFFALGGDSLSAARVFVECRRLFGRDLPLATLFEAPTLARLAEAFVEPHRPERRSLVVPIRSGGSRPRLFCVHGPSGEVVSYHALASYLDADQPFYGIQAQGLDQRRVAHARIEEMASHYVRVMKAAQPEGPYFLAGFCFGGQIAFEMARQLQGLGERVALLALMESFVRTRLPSGSVCRGLVDEIRRTARNTRLYVARLRTMPRPQAAGYLGRRARNLATRIRMLAWSAARRGLGLLGREVPERLRPRTLAFIHYRAAREYVPGPYSGRLTLFVSRESPEIPSRDRRLMWRSVAAGGVEVHVVPGGHDDMLTEPHVRLLASALQASLRNAQLGHPG